MGIFRAVTTAVSDSLEAQWKELFVCDALPDEVLISRGYKRISNQSANNNPNDETITHGSIILIGDGQCAIVVSGGKVIASCMTPGEYTYEDPDHTKLGLKSILQEAGRRISFGGEAPSSRGTQRVYYLNTRECANNTFSGTFPISYRASTGADAINATMYCHGMFSYRITDPILFYRLISGNVSGTYNRSRLTGQISGELLKALGSAAAVISERGIRPSQLSEHTEELSEYLRQALSEGWMSQRGLEMLSVGIDSLNSAETDSIQRLLYSSARRESIAGNSRHMPESHEQNAISFRSALKEQLMNTGGSSLAAAIQGKPPSPAAWTCACGATSSGRFCPECGAPRPWTCTCMERNTGKFCVNCGRPRPS